MNPVVEAVRQKYPGVYDDLTDDQLTLAIGKKAGGAYDDIKEFSEDFKRVSPYVAKMEDVGISGGEFEDVQPVELPPFGKPGTFTRGLSKALTSTVSGATSPGGVATGAALMVPGIGPALGVGMSAAALWQAAQKAQEAMETGSPEAAGEAAGMGVAGAAGTLLGVRGATGPKVREGVPPRPPRPSPLPRATAEAAKEFKPSFTIGLAEEPAPSAPSPAVEAKTLPAGEPTTTQPARAPATRTSIASRILQKAGLDPATADRFAGWVSTRAVGESLEAFRNDVLGKFRESGLQFPGQISLYRTEPSYYEAMGFNPQEVAEHVRNAEIANRKAVSDVQASNARVIERLESGKAVPAKPTTAPATRAPGTATAMPAAGELTPDEAQNLFLDKATAEDNAAIEQTKPAPAAPEQAPETQAPTAATVSEGKPPGVAAPEEPPALISQPTMEGQKPQERVTEPSAAVFPVGAKVSYDVMGKTDSGVVVGVRDNGMGTKVMSVKLDTGGTYEIPAGSFNVRATEPSPAAPAEPTPAPSAKVSTIAGIMDLTEFEKKGYAPEQVTKQDWIDLQRAERRRLGQQERGDNPNAPWVEYEQFHRDAVKAALAKGEEVDPEVLKDYPDLQASKQAILQAESADPSQAAAKEPWQMTREEAFMDRPIPLEQGWTAKVRYLDNPAGPNRGTVEIWQSEKPEKGKTGIGPFGRYEVTSVLRERPSRKQSHLPFWEKWDAEHRTAVEKAIKEGKPVPANVLAEYPELQASKQASLRAENADPSQAAAKVEAEVKAVARTEGQRPAKEVKNELVDRLQRAIDVAPTENEVRAKSYTTVQGKTVSTPDQAEKVTIDIPGDGVFTVRNTKEALTELLARAKRIGTSSTATTKKLPVGKVEQTPDLAAQQALEIYKDPRKAIASLERQLSSEQEIDPATRYTTERAIELLRDQLPEVKLDNQIKEASKAIEDKQTAIKIAEERLRVQRQMRETGRRAEIFAKQQQESIISAQKELPNLEKKLRALQKERAALEPAQGPGMAKGEIRPGPQPYDPSATAMGIRPPLTPFMREDVIPAVQTVVAGITETLEGLRNLLSPVSAGPKARLGAGIIREHAGRLAQKDVQMRAKFAAAHAAMSKMDKPSTLNWLDAVEGGTRATLTGPLRVFADEARAALDQRLREVQALGTGKLQHFIQDYFPHLWKRPDNAINWLQQIFGKRPLRGPASFLKHRTIPTTREGVDAGLEPVSWNPMDILLAKVHEMDRYIMGQKIFQEFKDKGLAKFSRSDIPPKGYAKIDDRIGNVIQYRPTVTVSGAPGAPERVLRGHWFVQEDAARMLNNFLSPGLERYAWYKALRWVGNNMNMATLGLSGYHGMFTMIDAGTSKLALGIEQATRGQPVAAATIPRGLVGTMAANQVEAFVKGSKVLQEYTKPGSVGGEYAKIVDGLIAAGGRVQMPEIYQNSTLRNFMNALRKGNYTGAVLRTPAAALHAFAYPLMNVVVPRLKLGVFFDMARMELERLGPTASRDEVREVLGKVWDSVDNRMGELVYDNLFWNKVLKDLSFLGIRSVGWNLGTLRELGGGVLDSATVIKRLRNGDPVLTRRMAYAIALPFTVGLMGALYQYLRTGKGPQEAEDYFYPKTGNTLPEGQPERVNFPSYLKDVESVKRHPVQTVINKMHPMWGAIAEMLQNKDYYGTEIIHPGDPLVRKVADELKFIAKSFVPYGISGAEKRGKIEPGIQPKVESFFGIMPVPAELTRTPAENLAITLMSGHKPIAARTKAEFERSQKERDAVQQIKMGKLTLNQAKTQGLVEPQRVKEVQERLRSGYLQYAMKHLSVDEAFQVLEKATPREASSVTTELRARIMRSTTIPPKEKQAYFKMLDQVSKRK